MTRLLEHYCWSLARVNANFSEEDFTIKRVCSEHGRNIEDVEFFKNMEDTLMTKVAPGTKTCFTKAPRLFSPYSPRVQLA